MEKGEPLSKIARAYGVSEAAILRTNGLRSYRQIKPGRVLVIAMAGASHGLMTGSQIDGRGRPPAQARATPPAAKAAAPQGPAATLYTVQPGDTLWKIATRFSTTVDKLCKLNGLTGRRARSLQVGQTIAVRET